MGDKKMIKELQKRLKEQNIKFYYVPTDDDHQSEIVGEHDQFRKYLSGFTGSAGVLVVGQEEAWLWTDGRYFIQAEKELYPGIKLMKMGNADVPSVKDFLIDHLDDGDVLGFNGKVTTASFIIDLDEGRETDFELKDIDMTDVWTNRPERSHEPAYIYDVKYHGQSTAQKLDWIRGYMEENECNAHIITSLDDIAWTFNIRGKDIPHSPMAMAFSIITLDNAYLYLQDGTYNETMIDAYKNDGVEIRSYDDIYLDTKRLSGQVLVDLSAINYAIYSFIDCEIMEGSNPSQYFKSIKSDVEIENTKHAHLKDGVAMTKFMYWLKTSMPDDATECSITDKLLSFREAQELFTDISFNTITAYKENAALMHYHPSHEHDVHVKKEGMLLIDSGGQYLDGTTDITRTFILGEISETERKYFTYVLKAMLKMQEAVFLYGANGIWIDGLVRHELWKQHIDFQCGTGHGVGHFLNVHEGPNDIRPRLRDPRKPSAIQEAGMITTDEPGVYIEGQFGIRLENELLCVEDIKNEYGQWMKFEPLTLCPIDLDGLDVSLLTTDERESLNKYHEFVRESLKPYLTDEENEWLKTYTRGI